MLGQDEVCVAASVAGSNDARLPFHCLAFIYFAANKYFWVFRGMVGG